MPMRILSYDGASYRAQLLRSNEEKGIGFPVVTMVLYFGEKKWDKPRSLPECLTIPERLKPYVSDYKINVFEICRPDPETVKLFKSDFKIVADYFVQTFRTKNYKASPDTIRHVDEVLKMLSIIAKDARFEDTVNEIYSSGEEGGTTMCEVLDRIEARGIAIGEARGIAIGEAHGAERNAVQSIRSLMTTLKFTAQQAMDALMIPQNEQEHYLALLNS